MNFGVYFHPQPSTDLLPLITQSPPPPPPRNHVWGDFPSLYSRFYKVIMHGSTNATNEGKNTNVILEIRLRL
jgi:hypothetical protein